MRCGIGPRPSLRDSRPFGVQPSVETLGYSRLSLRDSQAAVFPCRQNGPGVQQYDLWINQKSVFIRVHPWLKQTRYESFQALAGLVVFDRRARAARRTTAAPD